MKAHRRRMRQKFNQGMFFDWNGGDVRRAEHLMGLKDLTVHLRRTTLGDTYVSTIFMSINHNYFRRGTPILFETMSFSPDHEPFQWRYHSPAQAIRGHERIVKLVKAQLKTCPECSSVRIDPCGRGGKRCCDCNYTWGAD